MEWVRGALAITFTFFHTLAAAAAGFLCPPSRCCRLTIHTWVRIRNRRAHWCIMQVTLRVIRARL